MKELSPSTPAEAVAVFRHGIIGSLTQAQLERGKLRQALEQLSAQRFRPPGAQSTRQYSVATLERWYYAWQQRGLEGLKPQPRSDKGRAQALPSQVRQQLLDIRREHPHASVPLILCTLEADGRMDKRQVSATTVRRLFTEAGLDKLGLREGTARIQLAAGIPLVCKTATRQRAGSRDGPDPSITVLDNTYVALGPGPTSHLPWASPGAP